MDPGNHAVSQRVISGYPEKFVAPNTERDMAYYDALPFKVREALDDAPWAISTEAAFHHFRLHGLVSVLREIKESNDAFYTAFEQETGVPRPVKPLGKGAGVKLWRR
jgi:hypothetical protein